MTPKQGVHLQDLKEVAQRRFWYIVLPFFMVSMATIAYCIKAPRVYKSSTLILVQPPEIPSDYVRPTAPSVSETHPDVRLEALSAQIMSPPNLEKIIEKYDLYPEIRATFTMFDAVAAMREDIILEVNETGTGRWRQTVISSFELSYEGQDPTKVMHVTNAIAVLLIGENIKQRENQAAGTSKFLDREIERMKEHLRLKEKQIRQFKERHAGRLPEQMANNHRMLEQLERQLNSVNATIQETENRKVRLQTELARLTMEQAGTSQAGGFTGPTPVSLEEARYALGVLRKRYSEQHPDVVRLAATAAKLEKEQEASTPNTGPTTPGVTSAHSLGESTMGMQTETPLTELGLIDKQFATLAEKKRKLMTKIQIYEWRIQNGPVIEQKYVDLRRGYEEADQNYQSLLTNRLQAEMAENLERTQKGEQFVVLTPANLPQKPFKPNVGAMLILGFALALACGIGLPVLRENMDQTFWNREDLEKVVGLPVLISIPVVNTPSERRNKLFKRVGTAGALVSMAFVIIYALILLGTMHPVWFQFVPGG